MESGWIPGVAPWEDPSVIASAGPLPLDLGREAALVVPPPAERLSVEDAHEHDWMVSLVARRLGTTPEIGGDLTVIVMNQEALTLILIP